MPTTSYGSDLIEQSAYIYIYHLPSDVQGEGTLIYIPQWPDQISDSISSEFAATNALSRTAPVFSYIQSGPREVQISLQLHRDMMDEVNFTHCNVTPDDGDDYVDMFIKKLMAVALPNYHTASKEVEPPMVAVKFGRELFIKGVVSGGVTVEYQKPLLTNSRYAVVNVSFKVSEIDPQTALSISKVGSFRNITKTFQDIFDKY